MGTSSSSKGPGGGVPLIPTWVPPVDFLPNETPSPDENHPPEQHEDDLTPIPQDIAPPRRFFSARRSLGDYAQNGSQNDLRSGLGCYTRSGLGGAKRAAQRMGGTARTAGVLYDTLGSLREGAPLPVDLGIAPEDLKGKSSREVGSYIINAICPTDGTQDTEASREAVGLALSDLVKENPDVDLTTLAIDQIEFVTIHYVAYDLCHRMELDIGKSIMERAPDAATGVRRFEEIRQYVREKVFSCFRLRAEQGQRLTRGQTHRITATIIKDTFEVFEEYL